MQRIPPKRIIPATRKLAHHTAENSMILTLQLLVCLKKAPNPKFPPTWQGFSFPR